MEDWNDFLYPQKPTRIGLISRCFAIYASYKSWQSFYKFIFEAFYSEAPLDLFIKRYKSVVLNYATPRSKPCVLTRLKVLS